MKTLISDRSSAAPLDLVAPAMDRAEFSAAVDQVFARMQSRPENAARRWRSYLAEMEPVVRVMGRGERLACPEHPGTPVLRLLDTRATLLATYPARGRRNVNRVWSLCGVCLSRERKNFAGKK